LIIFYPHCANRNQPKKRRKKRRRKRSKGVGGDVRRRRTSLSPKELKILGGKISDILAIKKFDHRLT